MSDSASSFSITVECLINSPITEHNLILIYGVLIVFIILTNKFMNALLINLLLTLLLTTIDSKYNKALIFSLIAVFWAIDEYKSFK